MKTCTGVALVLLWLAGPAHADNDIPASDARSQVTALAQKWQAAYNKGDGRAVAKLYEDVGTQIFEGGVFKGQTAIEQVINAQAKAGARDLVISVDDARSVGNEIWSYGTYALHVNAQPVSGHWSGVDVRDGPGLLIKQRLSVPEPAGQAAPAK